MTPEHFWWWPMWWFPFFAPIFWIVLVVLCLYFFFGRGRRPWEIYAGKDTETPLDILKKRYVKGEITKEEFEQMKRDILG
jgi:putative membrane protein